MAKFFHNKKEIIFWFVAIALFFVLLTLSIYAISFLANKINMVANPNLIKESEIVRFNLNKVGELRR